MQTPPLVSDDIFLTWVILIFCLGSRVPSTSTKVEKSNDLDEFSFDESKDEESNEEGNFNIQR